MQNMTGGTYFTGGNGVGIAFEACGIRDVFGVEYDDKIAQVARDNGFPVLTADVRDVDPAQLPCVDWFHASPVCKNASTAKADGEESPEDIETARAVERYINYHKPRIVSLENVWGYRKFQAFQNILKCLARNGYTFEYWHLNAADYGVPQTRKRLILVARNDGIAPRKPQPTHFKTPSTMLGEKSWIGWYAAIEDLIDTLPPSKFADWQLKRLPKELFDSAMFGNDQSDDRKGTETGYGVITRRSAQPSITIKTTYEPRVFITAGGDDAWSPVLTDAEPLFTLSSSKAENVTRAFIMPNENSGSAVIRDFAEPSPTIGATQRVENISRAYLSHGRVVKMTPRALARFQSFPDDYQLPANTRLACTIIGNAVPPLLMQRVIEAQND